MNPNKFNEIRMNLGLTQDELAKGLGLSKQTVSQYETGFRRPGKTVSIVMRVLASLPKDQANKLFRRFLGEAQSEEGSKSSRKR